MVIERIDDDDSGSASAGSGTKRRRRGSTIDVSEVEFPGVSADTPQGPAAFQVSLLPSGVLPATPDAAAYPGLAHVWRS